MSGNFYRGTNIEQDGRFGDKARKLIKSRKWPPFFEQRVDIRKVNLKVFRPWINKQVSEYLGMEDEVVVNMCINELENCDEKGPDPRRIHNDMTGFLEDNTEEFMIELWKLLLKGQAAEDGVPEELRKFNETEIQEKIEEKKFQMSRLDKICEQIERNKVLMMKEEQKRKQRRSKSSPEKSERNRKKKKSSHRSKHRREHTRNERNSRESIHSEESVKKSRHRKHKKHKKHKSKKSKHRKQSSEHKSNHRSKRSRSREKRKRHSRGKETNNGFDTSTSSLE